MQGQNGPCAERFCICFNAFKMAIFKAAFTKLMNFQPFFVSSPFEMCLINPLEIIQIIPLKLFFFYSFFFTVFCFYSAGN